MIDLDQLTEQIIGAAIEVHRLIGEAYDSSRSILVSRHVQLERIARELIQKETLDRTALEELIRSSSEEVKSCSRVDL